MELPDIYIVRSALFGTDFNMKFWLAILTIGLVIWDMRSEHRKEYLWVVGIGFLIWSGAEFILQSLGIREIGNGEFYGIMLPNLIAIPLQGIAEGAAVIIFGLFIGDRIGTKRTRAVALTLLFALVTLILARVIFQDTSAVPETASRRELFAPLPLVFLSLVIFFDVIFWFRYPAFRKRTAMAALVIFSVVTIWTVAQVSTGNRWIEIATLEEYQPAPWRLSFFAFAFDVIVEIVFAYLPFFAIPAMAKKVGEKLLSR
ncbi:MAG: hypothetical protein HN916_08865 [Anaerolineae bacterium]|jgi:hypothetical protein|nr:hypothetical protein [Anaerolineae bacterium]